MNMDNQVRLIGAALVAALLATSSLAVYYKQRADRLMVESPQSVETVPAPPPPPDEPRIPAGVIHVTAPAPVEADTSEFQQRLEDLEIALAERNRIINDLQGQMAQSRAGNEEPRPWHDRNTWMEDMRTNDPERYQQMMERREEARRRTSEVFAKKAAHFLYRDESGMNEQEAEEYNLLIQLLNDTWRLHDQMQSDLPRDERWELRRAIGERMAVLSPMLQQERDRAFLDLAEQAGYRGESAHQFADYLHELIDITSFSGLFQGGRGGGGGPPFGDGPRGPQPPR